MFQVIRTMNDWGKFGQRTNIRTEVLFETNDLREAFIRKGPHNDKFAEKNFTQVRVFENGEMVDLVRLFELEVGPERWAEIEADESFSINLDDWFKAKFFA